MGGGDGGGGGQEPSTGGHWGREEVLPPVTPTKVQRQEQPVSNVVSSAVVDVEEGVGAAMRVVPQRKMDMMLTGRRRRI